MERTINHNMNDDETKFQQIPNHIVVTNEDNQIQIPEISTYNPTTNDNNSLRIPYLTLQTQAP